MGFNRIGQVHAMHGANVHEIRLMTLFTKQISVFRVSGLSDTMTTETGNSYDIIRLKRFFYLLIGEG